MLARSLSVEVSPTPPLPSPHTLRVSYLEVPQGPRQQPGAGHSAIVMECCLFPQRCRTTVKDQPDTIEAYISNFELRICTLPSAFPRDSMEDHVLKILIDASGGSGVSFLMLRDMLLAMLHMRQERTTAGGFRRLLRDKHLDLSCTKHLRPYMRTPVRLRLNNVLMSQ